MNPRILSVNTARARVIGAVHGEPVLSGIDKKPVATGSVFVRMLGIDGDQQADLSVHGGVDKAVYAYPSGHWPWWEREKKLSCRPATFGENLTLEGADENSVSIGDRFQWGDAILEVSQPRAPCYKLAIHTSRPDVPQLMTHSARCGWYFRVVGEGAAPVQNANLVHISDGGAPTVREAFVALFDRRAAFELCVRVRDSARLAGNWRGAVGAKIDRLWGQNRPGL
jgi:MOSC domain-containing protein YiiM